MEYKQHINKFEVKSLLATCNIASLFSKQINIGNIIVLCGDLGAGKTEFIRAICSELGVTETITSPTFTIINQYECNFATIFHIDLYRISKKEELLEIGFYELFDFPNSIFFIEWPENSFDTLPRIDYKIQITYNAQTTREIEIIQYF